jgi:hypothetical protein
MRGRFILMFAIGLPVILCGCAVDANNSFMPDFLKQRAAKAEVEQPPDVASIVRGNMTAVFVEASSPTDISFSFPVRAKYGGWTTCLRASVNGATGRPMGVQTYLVNIDQGRVERRERVDDKHWCAKEIYQPL